VLLALIIIFKTFIFLHLHPAINICNWFYFNKYAIFKSRNEKTASGKKGSKFSLALWLPLSADLRALFNIFLRHNNTIKKAMPSMERLVQIIYDKELMQRQILLKACWKKIISRPSSLISSIAAISLSVT
jgi:hypothetical protein